MTDAAFESVEDRLLGAFDVAGRGVHPEKFDIETADPSARRMGQIGSVTLPPTASVVFNDSTADTIDEELALHGWEVGTVRATEDGMIVSVWEASDA